MLILRYMLCHFTDSCVYKLHINEAWLSTTASTEDTGEANNPGSPLLGCFVVKEAAMVVRQVRPSPSRLSTQALPPAPTPQPSPPEAPGLAPCPVLVLPGSPGASTGPAGEFTKKHEC